MGFKLKENLKNKEIIIHLAEEHRFDTEDMLEILDEYVFDETASFADLVKNTKNGFQGILSNILESDYFDEEHRIILNGPLYSRIIISSALVKKKIFARIEFDDVNLSQYHDMKKLYHRNAIFQFGSEKDLSSFIKNIWKEFRRQIAPYIMVLKKEHLRMYLFPEESEMDFLSGDDFFPGPFILKKERFLYEDCIVDMYTEIESSDFSEGKYDYIFISRNSYRKLTDIEFAGKVASKIKYYEKLLPQEFRKKYSKELIEEKILDEIAWEEEFERSLEHENMEPSRFEREILAEEMGLEYEMDYINNSYQEYLDQDDHSENPDDDDTSDLSEY